MSLWEWVILNGIEGFMVLEVNVVIVDEVL